MSNNNSDSPMKNPSPKWCNRKPCSNPGRCEWIGSCYRDSKPNPNQEMKTIPLEEALELATKGPLSSGTLSEYHMIYTSDIALHVARCVGLPNAESNAALLAHFYNHGPELFRALDDLLAAQIDPMGIKAAHARARACSILDKASTVQMP